MKCSGKEGNATGLLPLKGTLSEMGLLADGIYDTGSALLSKDRCELRIPTGSPADLARSFPAYASTFSSASSSSSSGKKRKCQDTSKEVI